MDIREMKQKVTEVVGKYRYAVIVVAVGIGLMLLPGKKTETQTPSNGVETTEVQELGVDQQLQNILTHIQGAGRVEVMMTVASGEVTVYQCDEDITSSEQSSVRKDTVIISDQNRNQSGLIQQINPPEYRGAIVVCQGADSPSVRLAIADAVSKVTGLGTDKISILKMK